MILLLQVVQCIAISIKHFNHVRNHVILPDNDVTPKKVEASLAKREDKLTDELESLASGQTGSSSSGYGSDVSELKHRKTRYDPSHQKIFQKKVGWVNFCSTEYIFDGIFEVRNSFKMSF